MLNGEQDIVDRPVNSARRVVLRPSAGGNNQHRPFPRERALTVAISPVRIAVLADAVGKPVSVDPVNPALHDGGQRKPPQRELKNHRIGPQQLLLFARDIRALRAVSEGVLRLPRCPPAFTNRRGAAVIGIQSRLPAHGIEIGHLYVVAGVLQMLHGKIFQRAVKRTRFGMGVNQ